MSLASACLWFFINKPCTVELETMVACNIFMCGLKKKKNQHLGVLHIGKATLLCRKTSHNELHVYSQSLPGRGWELSILRNIQNPTWHSLGQPAIANHALSKAFGLDNLQRSCPTSTTLWENKQVLKNQECIDLPKIYTRVKELLHCFFVQENIEKLSKEEILRRHPHFKKSLQEQGQPLSKA